MRFTLWNFNYQGRSIEVCYDQADLGRLNFDNLANSVKVSDGFRVTLFDSISYHGASTVLVGDQSCLSHFRKLTTSLTIRRRYTPDINPIPRPIIRIPIVPVNPPPDAPRNGCILMFEHVNYAGRWMQVCGTIADFVPIGWNDILSSVKVSKNIRAVFYEHINYGGKELEVKSNTAILPQGWNDIASSVKLFTCEPHQLPGPIIPPRPQPPIRERPDRYCYIVYEHVNFQGKSAHLCESVQNLTSSGFNDNISSIKVGQDAKVVLFKDVNYKGIYSDYTRDESDLGKRNFDDITSSIELFRILPRPIIPTPTPRPRPVVPVIPKETYNIGGRIKNALNGDYYSTLEGFSITAQGKDGRRYTSELFRGAYSFKSLEKGEYQFSVVKAGFITLKITREVNRQNSLDESFWTFSVTPQMPSNMWRVVLTWGANPKDLDVHVKHGSETVNYTNRKTRDGNVVLDVDMTSGYGPETVTITNKLIGNDKINYYIHNYSRHPSITTSNAVVNVYNGNILVQNFRVPKTGNGLLWHVFNLYKDRLVVVNKLKWSDSDI